MNILELQNIPSNEINLDTIYAARPALNNLFLDACDTCVYSPHTGNLECTRDFGCADRTSIAVGDGSIIMPPGEYEEYNNFYNKVRARYTHSTEDNQVQRSNNDTNKDD